MIRGILKLLTAIVLFAVLVISGQPVYAEEDYIMPDLGLDNSDYNLPPEIHDRLYNFGITPQEIQDGALSPENIIRWLFDTAVGYVTKPATLFAALLGVIITMSLTKTLTLGGGTMQICGIIGVLISAASVTLYTASAVSGGSTAIKSGTVFLQSFIPAFAGIIGMSGFSGTAAVLNTVIMGAAQIFMQLSVNILLPFCTALIALSVASCVCPDIKADRLAAAIQKAMIWAMGLFMTIFTALLSLQSFIALPQDNVAMKAAKFTVSGTVPFVGGAISDALSAMTGGIGIIRSGFGVFGIAAGAVMILPVVIEAMLFKLSLMLSAAVSEMFGTGEVTALIKSAEGVISVIIAMLACFLLMLIISVSLMIFLIGGM